MATLSARLVNFLKRCESEEDKDAVSLHAIVDLINSETNVNCNYPSTDTIGKRELVEDIVEWGNGNGIVVVGHRELARYLARTYDAPYFIPTASENKPANTTLEEHGKCLTDRARSGKLDPVVDREEEIQRCIDVLCMRSKNNPLLVGEGGVGKTAIVHGVAMRIASGNVPAHLKSRRIYQVDITNVVRGTVLRGQFEERIKKVIDAAISSKDIVFFDEVHTLVGAGGSTTGGDAANILKPYLTGNELSVIGATTPREYRNTIEKDSALRRRFMVVKVQEPSVESTADILEGMRELTQEHHGVVIDPELVPRIVELAERHIHQSRHPDKSLDLMDASSVGAKSRALSTHSNVPGMEEWKALVLNGELVRAAHLRSSQVAAAPVPRVHVTEEDVVSVLSRWKGTKVVLDDLQRLTNLEEDLKAQIIGQDGPIEEVVRRLRSAFVFKREDRVLGSLLFLGPPGVGKTLMAEVLAKLIFDDTILRLDMSSYADRFAVSSLTGSPPGYVGYDDGGVLTDFVWQHPYCLLLFDEVEKAHSAVTNILLSIMDAARVQDMQGRVARFSSSLLIMTSNAGTEHMAKSKPVLGFKDKMVDGKKEVREEVARIFKPEFRDRITSTIIFNTLTTDDMMGIIDLEAEKICSTTDGPHFTMTPGAKKVILKKLKAGSGARHIGRKLGTMVEEPLAQKVVEKEIGRKADVVVHAKGDKVYFKVRS